MKLAILYRSLSYVAGAYLETREAEMAKKRLKRAGIDAQVKSDRDGWSTVHCSPADPADPPLPLQDRPYAVTVSRAWLAVLCDSEEAQQMANRRGGEVTGNGRPYVVSSRSEQN